MSEILLYLFSLIINFGINVGIHTEIGKYWFSEDECGIGRDSQLMDNSCFDWHPSQEQTNAIRWGRHARGGEFPWIMTMEHPQIDGKGTAWCTVSIINRFWIITAAHCFEGFDHPNGSFVFTIESKLLDKSLHRKVRIQYAFNHPGFLTASGNLYDLAVARLKQPLDLNQNSDKGYRDLNAICFPKRYAVNKDYEHALLVGTGTIGNGSWGKVWTGWTRIYPLGRGGNYKLDNAGLIIRVRQLINEGGSATCSGDSGSPLVQYVNGRAVMIGINSGSISDPESVKLRTKRRTKGCTEEKAESIFARVSRFMDWINDKITLGEKWASINYVQPRR